MTDASLRDLERRFRASGSVEDESVWLRARLRAGELTSERVELAARLGAEGPRQALDMPALVELAFDQELQRSIEVVSDATERGAVALARRFLPVWEREEVFQQIEANHAEPRVAHGLYTPEPPSEPLPSGWRLWARQLIEAREAALVGAPPSVSVSGLFEQLETLPTSPYAPVSSAHMEEPLTGLRGTFAPDERSDGAIALVASSVLLTHLAEGQPLRSFSFSFRSLRQAFTELAPWRAGALVLQQELVPWTLGYSDPVRERVEARRREAAGE